MKSEIVHSVPVRRCSHFREAQSLDCDVTIRDAPTQTFAWMECTSESFLGAIDDHLLECTTQQRSAGVSGNMWRPFLKASVDCLALVEAG